MSEGVGSSERDGSERSTASAMPEAEAREGYMWVQSGPKSVEIPEEWEVRHFGDVFEKRHEKITAEEGEKIRYVGLDDIESDNIHLQDHDENGAERSSTRGFREGDILFGKLRPYLNKAAVAPFDGVCSSDIIPIYATGESTQRFLLYLMHSKIMRDRAIATTSGTNLPRTSWGDLASAKFPYPSHPEQRRIAEVLSTVDEQIQQTEAVIETAEKLKQGLMQDLYESGYESHQETKSRPFGTVPADWELGRIDSYAEVISGTHVKSDLVTNDPTQTPYLTGPADFERTGFKVTKYTDSPKKFCEAGDVLITVKGMGCGQSALADQGVAISRQLKSIRPGESIDQRFLFYWLRRKEQVLNILAEGTRQPGLSVSDIESFPLPIPPLEGQQKIGETLSTVEGKIVEETDYRDRLQELKRGLMQDLLTGAVRVPGSIEAED